MQNVSLKKSGSEEEVAALRVELSSLRYQLRAAKIELATSEAALTKLSADLIELSAELRKNQQIVETIFRSRSWRWLSPIRNFNFWMRSYRKHLRVARLFR